MTEKALGGGNHLPTFCNMISVCCRVSAYLLKESVLPLLRNQDANVVLLGTVLDRGNSIVGHDRSRHALDSRIRDEPHTGVGENGVIR